MAIGQFRTGPGWLPPPILGAVSDEREHPMATQISTPIFYLGLLYRDADAGMNWLEDVLGCECREDHLY